MSSFYDRKDPSELGLEEELSQVNCQDELEFDYLFEYEPHAIFMPSSTCPSKITAWEMDLS